MREREKKMKFSFLSDISSSLSNTINHVFSIKIVRFKFDSIESGSTWHSKSIVLLERKKQKKEEEINFLRNINNHLPYNDKLLFWPHKTL